MNEVTWALEESMFKFDIEWRLPDDRAGGRNNAMWYTNKIDPELVCTVKIKDKSLPIYRVGEMLIKIRNFFGPTPSALRMTFTTLTSLTITTYLNCLNSLTPKVKRRCLR